MRSSGESLTLIAKRRELTLIKKQQLTLIKQDTTTVKNQRSLDHIEKQQQKEHARRKNHYIDHHQFDTQTKGSRQLIKNTKVQNNNNNSAKQQHHPYPNTNQKTDHQEFNTPDHADISQ
jgi:hypothetical protein